MTNYRGTSRSYSLAQLREKAPEFADRVEAGEMSAHAAMIESGLRPYSFTVRASNPEAVAETLRRQLPRDWLSLVAERLAA